MAVVVVRVIRKRECYELILRCDVRQSREIHNDRRERRIVRTESHTDLPREHSLPGHRIQERRHCGFRCHLLGMGRESSDRSDVAGKRKIIIRLQIHFFHKYL